MVEIGGHAFFGYDEALQDIIGELKEMSSHVDELLVMLENALASKKQDPAAAKAMDKEVNKLEYAIIDQLHFILQRYTPSFQELWFLTSLNKVAASLERVGDLAKRSIRACDKLPEGFSAQRGEEVCQILELARSMLQEALENVQTYHPQKAADIVKKEQQINEQSADLRYAILKDAIAANDPYAEHRKMLIIRDIERIAEHAMDILRMAFFAHTGERFKRKKALSA